MQRFLVHLLLVLSPIPNRSLHLDRQRAVDLPWRLAQSKSIALDLLLSVVRAKVEALLAGLRASAVIDNEKNRGSVLRFHPRFRCSNRQLERLLPLVEVARCQRLFDIPRHQRSRVSHSLYCESTRVRFQVERMIARGVRHIRAIEHCRPLLRQEALPSWLARWVASESARLQVRLELGQRLQMLKQVRQEFLASQVQVSLLQKMRVDEPKQLC